MVDKAQGHFGPVDLGGCVVCGVWWVGVVCGVGVLSQYDPRSPRDPWYPCEPIDTNEQPRIIQPNQDLRST